MLTNKKALITGASSGIGYETAKLFAQNNVNLLLFSRNIDKIKNDIEEWKIKYNIKIEAFQVDVQNLSIVNNVFEKLDSYWDDIDFLVNNAGLALGLETIEKQDVNDWEIMIDTNIKGLLYITKKVLPLMKKNNKGHIINIGSVAGVWTYANGVVYCATKAAVKTISEGIRIELVDTPIKVTNIQPGLVETNFSITRFKGDNIKAKKVYEGIEALTAIDIAEVILWVCSTKPHVQIAEVTIMPTNQATSTVVFRKN
ncbi:MAG: SDR family NAD(P)-dependent oxidoreductase [Spirochaetales bacterium]|nr:SDR family NAD(P)-dependent oxidoreductase [Spirochaetales bacterium]